MYADPHRSGAAFFLEVNSDEARATITVLGEVDLAGCEDLEACFEEALATGARVLELEMSGVAFIDLRGIEPIIELEGECRQRGVELRLNTSAAMDKVLSLLAKLGAIPSDFPG